MATKTAMQELIHDFKYGKFNGLTLEKADNVIKKYLDKEEEQIRKAYTQGYANALKSMSGGGTITDQEYYNEVYGK